MAITYTWTIENVKKTIATGGINQIHWRCTAVEGANSARNYGIVGCIPDPDADNFIAYADVTEANCLAWAQAALGKDDIEAALAARIELIKTPTQSTGVPW
tara:strand:+ start:782 stop:1084 length:303 start_codon:yes stop_codon:yes gene_type:complete